MEDYKFLPDDFELIGDKQNIMIDEVAPSKPQWKDILDRFMENKGAVIGICLIVLITLLAIIVPMVSRWGVNAENTAIANQAPSSVHFFGTDYLGRDLWVRTWQGTRYSLIIAVVAVVIDVLIGITYGMISGYFGGMVDSVLQRIQEIINSIPTLVVLIILLTVMKASLTTVIVALIFTEWIPMSRITRAQVLKVKEDEFVLASRTLGAGNIFILFKEILPNIFGQLIIMSMMTIPNAIFYEAYLAFVGLGLTKPLASLGTLINDGFSLFQVHPHAMVIPAIVMAVLMLSFNLFGDGLRDALDPTMKEM
ncbi:MULTISPECIES: ABC transporter permease [Kandleria]|jgi:oligopeptide transport system permease protein|uniref:Oligopeptide ABC transporter, membrane-spanning subunit n=2 Tax=Kandleria vitulina TaxID=1630 RepID=A0A0R2HLB6_9FIRM|nr:MULTISPECIES: ABC transporter permease [Kandleria]KRN50282.1 oligopeptide ABC transporter, membrane-spanning subunit [Kandleria vitulina DSM 20405]MBP3276045.1 ABC transporter permease [Kandleria sp.]MEE0987775.1 ABC transporter permease [Kandleria vitulina]SDL20049.1 oligopeptide transport system permease protein [Kandleria vitulina]SDW08079.1 oligopeptide transport system permease protein [Kandleria vitulina]